MRSFVLALVVLWTALASSSAWSLTASIQPRQNNGQPTNRSTKKTCNRILALKFLTNLSTNQTALDAMLAKGKLDKIQVAWIKSEATNLSAELTTLTSNTTLTAECNTIRQQRKLARKCKRLAKLEKLAALAGNQTALDERIAKLNQKQVEKLKKKIEKAPGKLEALKKNGTLVALCSNGTLQSQQDGVIGNGKF